MAFCQFTHAVLKGVAVTLGETEHAFENEPVYYNHNEVLCRRLQKTIGFGRRRQARPETTTCDLCTDAAGRLFRALDISPESIDAVISVTQTPDYRLPGNAHVLHERLGLPKTAAAVDVEMGCSGFIYGLWLSYMMVSSGMGRVLLLTGDTLSKLIHPKDRTEAPLFGDAGAATLIERSETPSPSAFLLKSNGKGVPFLLQPAGGHRCPSSEETRREKEDRDGSIRTDENIYMNGLEIFNFTLTEQPQMLSELFEKTGKTPDGTDYFVFHQANSYIVQNLAKSAGLPMEKVPVVFPEYGNQNSASIPGTLCGALSGKLEGRKRLLFQGFGIGLSWGACLLETESVTVLEPCVYAKEENHA